MDPIVVTIFLIFLVYVAYHYFAIKKRRKYIQEYNLPNRIKEKVISTYPHLNDNDGNNVIKGLKEYFAICNIAKLKMISMPSQVVDVAWHEFILFTRQYKEFCNKGFGKFLHHTPAETMKSQTVAQAGIKRAWRLSCRREGIWPKNAHKLPLLFSIDSDLSIPDGFKYALDCTNSKENYCAGHIGCGGGCSGGGCGGDGGGGGGE